jgi:hypothetical protein
MKANKIERLESDNKQAWLWLGQCQTANAKNQNSIGVLKAANSSLGRMLVVSEETRQAAVAEAEERERRAQIELDDTINSLQELQNESLSCNELMQVDLGAVCPLTVERLREHAEGNRRD